MTPFEIKEVRVAEKGFKISFTKPVDSSVATDPDAYQLKTFTHIYRQGYGSPEVDQTTPTVTDVAVADDGKAVELEVEGRVQGHVHEFHLPTLISADNEKLLHADAYYTLNEIPR